MKQISSFIIASSKSSTVHISRISFILFFIFLSAFFLLPSDVFADIIEINPDMCGDDVSAPFCTIQPAIDIASTGDTINVAAGTYAISSTIVIDKPLTLLGPQANIDPRTEKTLRTAGDSKEAIIDGQGGVSQIFNIQDSDVTINGFEIKSGTGDLIKSDTTTIANPKIQYNIIHDSSTDEGIQLKKTKDALIEYNHIYNVQGDGINLALSHNGIIQYNEVHQILSPNAAIYVYNDAQNVSDFSDFINATIQNNLVYDVRTNDGIKLGDDSEHLDEFVKGGSILNNIIHDVKRDGITVLSSDVVVDGNEIHNTSGENGAIFLQFEISNIQVTNNNIHDNGIANFGDETANDDSEITYGIKVGGFRLGQGSDDLQSNVIINNNILQSNEGGLSYYDKNTEILDASKNYWNDATGPSGIGTGDGESISATVDSVDFFPFCIDDQCSTFSKIIVDADGNGEFTTIQSAIDVSSEGDIISVKNGTYTQTSSLNLNKDGIIIIGESESDTIIDVTGISASNQNAMIWNNDSVTLKNVTLQGPSTHFGIKISGANNPTLENVTVLDSKRTGLDLNGVNGGSITNVTVIGTTGGFGINMVDSNDLTLTDITTSGNAWGGVSIQSEGFHHPGGSDNISFKGTFDVAEGNLLLEQDPCRNLEGGLCTEGEFVGITNIELPAKYEFASFGLRNPGSEDYRQTFYVETLAEAKTLGDALATGSHVDVIIHDVPIPGAVLISVEDRPLDNLYVLPSMSIADAITASSDSDTINLDTGTHSMDATEIDKNLKFVGAGNGEDDSINTLLTVASTVNIRSGGTSDTDRFTISDMRVTGDASNAFWVFGDDYFLFNNLALTNMGGTPFLIWDFDSVNPTATDSNVIVSNSNFENNGCVSGSHPADVKFFEFTGHAVVQNVTIAKTTCDDPDKNDNTFAIEFRGLGCDTESDTLLDQNSILGSALLKDVTITGNPVKHALLVQCYADVTDFVMEGVDMSGVVADTTELYPTTFLLSHTGPTAFDLGDTKLNDMILSQVGNVDATDADFGTRNNFDIEDSVIHAMDDFEQGLDSPFHTANSKDAGIVEWKKNNLYVTTNSASVQRGVDNIVSGGIVNVDSGSYTGLVTIDRPLTLKGQDKTDTFIEDGIELSTDSGNLEGVKITNLYLTGESPGSHPWFQTIGGGQDPPNYIKDLVIDDNIFDGARNFDATHAPTGEPGNPTTGVGSAIFLFKSSGDFTFTNNEVKNYPHHELVYVGQDTIANTDGESFGNVLIENNKFQNNNGLVAVYGSDNDVTDSYIVRNNDFVNKGDPDDASWALIEISNVDNVVIEENTFADKDKGQKFSFIDGTAVYFSRSVPTVSSFERNVFTNVEVAITVDSSVTTPIDAKNNYWGSKKGPIHSSVSGGEGSEIIATNITLEPYFIDSGFAFLSTDTIPSETILVFTDDDFETILDDANDGDTIKLQAGTHDVGTITITKPITIISDTGDYRTSNTILSGDSQFQISGDVDGVTIQGLKFEDLTGDAFAGVVHISSGDGETAQNITIEKNSFNNIPTHAVKLNANNNNVIINDNKMTNIGAAFPFTGDVNSGIAALQIFDPTNLSITNNIIDTVTQAGINLSRMSGTVIEGNTISNTDSSGINICCTKESGNAIRDNTITNTNIDSSSADKGGISLYRDTDGIEITGNTLKENKNGLTIRDAVGKFVIGEPNNDADFFTDNYVATQNSFIDNTGLQIGIFTGDARTIDATKNWFGNKTGPNNPSNDNPSGTGGTVSDNISFIPFSLNSGNGLFSDEIDDSVSDEKTITPTSEKVTFDDGDDTAEITGQAALPEDVVEIQLKNDAVLDVNDNIEEKVGDEIEVGGDTIDLTTFDIQSDDDDDTDTTVQEDLTQTQTVANVDIVIEKAVKLESGTDTKPIIIKNVDLPTVEVSIPDETTILAPTGWTGTIQPPKTGSSSGTPPSGFSVSGTVIEVGSPDAVLLFDTPVTLTLSGVTGAVGYKPAGSSVWTHITETCGGTFADPDAPTAFPGECFISDGVDTKISTYHFTSFGGLGTASSSSTPRSGGGGGGDSISPDLRSNVLSSPDSAIYGGVLKLDDSVRNSASIFETGDTVDLELSFYENSGSRSLMHVTLFTNIRDYDDRFDSNLYVEWNRDEPLKVFDSEGYLDEDKTDVSFTITDDNVATMIFHLNFVKPMDVSHVVLNFWDYKRNAGLVTFNDALTIVEPLYDSSILSPDENQTVIPQYVPEPVADEPSCGVGTEKVNGKCQAIIVSEAEKAASIVKDNKCGDGLKKFKGECVPIDTKNPTSMVKSIPKPGTPQTQNSEPPQTLTPEPKTVTPSESVQEPPTCGNGTVIQDGMCVVVVQDTSVGTGIESPKIQECDIWCRLFSFFGF